MTVVATGSVAFDYILSFDGRFGDHILPDRKHVINLSFLVERLQRRRGGVALNYAYNLRLLGHPAAVLATIGADGAEHREWLESIGVDCRGLVMLEDELTATGFTTTDQDDNQITGYYGGAMNRAAVLGLEDTVPEPAAVIIGPNAPDAMRRLVREARETQVPRVFDPAHQLPHLSPEDLVDGSRGAWILIGNDYEVELVRRRAGFDQAALSQLPDILVTTLGAQGSEVLAGGERHVIPAAPVRDSVDPTGAGDAYRAGLVAGLLRGLDLPVAGRVASLAAAWTVEQVGTVEHTYTAQEFQERYRASFGSDLPGSFWD